MRTDLRKRATAKHGLPAEQLVRDAIASPNSRPCCAPTAPATRRRGIQRRCLHILIKQVSLHASKAASEVPITAASSHRLVMPARTGAINRARIHAVATWCSEDFAFVAEAAVSRSLTERSSRHQNASMAARCHRFSSSAQAPSRIAWTCARLQDLPGLSLRCAMTRAVSPWPSRAGLATARIRRSYVGS